MVAVAALTGGVARMKMTACLGMLARMDHSVRFPCLFVVAALLAGCGTMRSSVVIEPAAGSYSSPAAVPASRVARTPIPGGSYVVAKGDTLYSIAFRNGVDFRDLAQWNAIAVPYTIWPGQRLTLSPPAAAKVAPHAPAPVGSSRAPSVVASAPVFEPVTASTPAPSATVAARPHAQAAPATSAPHASPAPADAVPVAGVSVTPPAKAPPIAKPVVAGAAREVSGVSWRWPVEGGSLVGRFNSSDAIPGIEIAGNSGDPVRAAADGVVVYSGNGLVGYGELVIIKHNDSFLSAYGHNRKRLVKEGQRVTAGQQIAEMGSTGTTRNELEFQIRKNGNPVDPLSYLPPR
ncbi:Peptidase M23 OS=Rhodanobacter lindaniclasticus OX=75310 GN=B1991_12320 PE=3 SV=1 [Rhodanobacter lindaniclasticus]